MTDATESSNKKLGYILLVFIALLFAIFLEATRYLDRDLDWQAAVVVRGVFGLLVAIPLAWPSRSHFKLFQRQLLIRNSLTCAYLFGLLYAASVIAPADAIAVTSTQPIWIAIISMVFLGARYFFKFWVACVAVVVGMALLVTAKPTDAFSIVLLLIFVTILRGIAILMLSHMKAIPSTIIALHLALVITIAGVVVFFLSGGHDNYAQLLDVTGILLLLTIGISASVYSVLFVKVIDLLGAITGGLVTLLAAVFAYIMDIFLWNDAVTSVHIFGLFLVIIPVGWIVSSKHVEKEKQID